VAAVAAALGYSVNVLSILAVILAIGLCVDDAVVIMENIRRRQQDGEPLMLAAVRATRQVGFAVFASSLALLSVILPLAFLQGNVGRLFAEFAVVLGATILFSTLAAITLGPMLSAWLFRGAQREGRIARLSARAQAWLARHYAALLGWLIARPALALGAGLIFAAAGAAPTWWSRPSSRRTRTGLRPHHRGGAGGRVLPRHAGAGQAGSRPCSRR
jgi:multidrug efflux pump